MLFYTLPPLMRPNCKYNVTNQRLLAVNTLFISASIRPLNYMATYFDPHYVYLKPIFFYTEGIKITCVTYMLIV